MTLIDSLRANKRDSIITKIASIEDVSIDGFCSDILNGYTVIPKNKKRSFDKACAIGKGLKIKVNVNLGTSPDYEDIEGELRKLDLSVRLGTDTVMDLSVGANLEETLKRVLEHSPVPVGTVPIYEACVKAGNNVKDMRESDFIKAIKRQAEEGVDFFTIHAGITKNTLKVLKESSRLIDIVSRGGAIIHRWMTLTGNENPLFTRFDEILDIAREFDITLSLGDGMRPGAVIDATDAVQLEELKKLGELQKRALKKGVQVIIEGPGHVPLNQIKKNVDLEKSYCNGAPFYVLGPLVTDIAPGYDHITSAIGGAVAASCGADFLCYVTPSEHVRLPSLKDVRDGLVASKIAAHVADLARGNKSAMQRDIDLSKARRKRDWKRQFDLSIDPEKPAEYRKDSRPSVEDVCTMCGEFCPIKISEGTKKS